MTLPRKVTSGCPVEKREEALALVHAKRRSEINAELKASGEPPLDADYFDVSGLKLEGSFKQR